MRLSDSARRWIRKRANLRDAQAICDLAESADPSLRELFSAMREALGPGAAETLQALAPGLAALQDPAQAEAALEELERELPSVRQVLATYAMLDLPERTRDFIAAWNQGPDAVQEHLVATLASGMVVGMLVERMRRGGGPGEAV